MSQAPHITAHEGRVGRAERERLLRQKGVVLWMTGLSAAGKSTIAALLEEQVITAGKLAFRLDGDNVRLGLNKNLGFSAEDRTENIRRIGEVAKLFVDAGMIVLVSFISPYRKDRDAVRQSLGKGDFVEVYVKASLAAVQNRDPKGLYKKVQSGELKGFTGVDDPYEPPGNPEVILDTERASAEESARVLFDFLKRGGYLGS